MTTVSKSQRWQPGSPTEAKPGVACPSDSIGRASISKPQSHFNLYSLNTEERPPG